MPSHFLGLLIVAKAPHLAVLVIAVEIGVAELGKFGALIDIAARYGPAIRVMMFHDRRNDGSRSTLARRNERMRAFHHTPAVIRAFVRQLDHFPKILADV